MAQILEREVEEAEVKAVGLISDTHIPSRASRIPARVFEGGGWDTNSRYRWVQLSLESGHRARSRASWGLTFTPDADLLWRSNFATREGGYRED